MFDGGGDDMELCLIGAGLHGAAEYAVDGEVEGIGAAVGEDDAVGRW